MTREELNSFEKRSLRANIAETWARAAIKIALAVCVAAAGVSSVFSDKPLIAISYTSGAN